MTRFVSRSRITVLAASLGVAALAIAAMSSGAATAHAPTPAWHAGFVSASAHSDAASGHSSGGHNGETRSDRHGSADNSTDTASRARHGDTSTATDCSRNARSQENDCGDPHDRGDDHHQGHGHGHGHGRRPHHGNDSQSVLSLNPPSGTSLINTPYTITASVSDANGPVAGQGVSFDVSGANAGAGGSCVPADCVTDDSGTVTGTYVGTNAGDDTVTASLGCDRSGCTASVGVTWTSEPTTTASTTTTPTTETTTTTSAPPETTTSTTPTTEPPETTTSTTPTTEPPETTTSTTTPTPPPTPIPPTIFQVELRKCVNLHIGYNRFPAGLTVRWSVSQAKSTIASGEFTAQGGGKTYHFLTMPLGATLSNTSKGTAHFRWFLDNTKFNYTVGRAAGC